MKVSKYIWIFLLQKTLVPNGIAANRSKLFGFVPILQFQYENLNFSLKVRIFRNTSFLPLIFNNFYVPIADENNKYIKKNFLCSFTYTFLFNIS